MIYKLVILMSVLISICCSHRLKGLKKYVFLMDNEVYIDFAYRKLYLEKHAEYIKYHNIRFQVSIFTISYSFFYILIAPVFGIPYSMVETILITTIAVATQLLFRKIMDTGTYPKEGLLDLFDNYSESIRYTFQNLLTHTPDMYLFNGEAKDIIEMTAYLIENNSNEHVVPLIEKFFYEEDVMQKVTKIIAILKDENLRNHLFSDKGYGKRGVIFDTISGIKDRLINETTQLSSINSDLYDSEIDLILKTNTTSSKISDIIHEKIDIKV